MKKNFILLPVLMLLGYIISTGYSTGSSTNMTISTGDTTGCGGSGCHGKREAGVSTVVYLEDSAGNAVYKYRPGKKYLIKYTAFYISAASLPKFGFQLLALDGTNHQAGKFNPMTLPAGTMLDSSSPSGRVIFEHRTKLSQSSTTVYETSIGWTAPPVGTDTVSFYTITCLANNDGDTTGDKWNRGATYKLAEEDFVGVDNVASVSFTLFPNPVQNTLFINGLSNVSSIQVFDLSGRVVYTGAAGIGRTAVSTANWQAGMYYVVATDATGASGTATVVKQ